MNHAKEELDKERKLLQKKRPQLEKESGSKSTKETKLVKCNFFVTYLTIAGIILLN
jgi:hypothetical protein